MCYLFTWCKFTAACKDTKIQGHFCKGIFHCQKCPCDSCRFYRKRQAIVHGRLATGIVFPLWVPNCHLGERQFGSFFTKIPRSWNQEFPYYKGFRGVGRENSAPLLAPSPPPPYAYDAIASLSLAEYVRSFRLCRCTGCRCRACPSAVMAHHET